MEKTVLSFDVGIVNLAYCILKKKDNKQFEILKWDIINIDDNKLTCSHKNKNDKICDSNAKFSLNEEYYCTSHYNSFMKSFNKIYEKENILTKLEDNLKEKCCENKCKSLCEYNLNKKNYCSKHIEKNKKEYYANNTPKKIKNQNSNYKSINNLSSILFKKLDILKNDFLKVDEVLIENQPSLINPTMKTISALLYSYFSIRGIIDKSTNSSTVKEVHFISPQNKLKINKETTDKTLDKNKDLKKREEYILTKDLGKKYCRCLVEKEKKYTDILDSHKKNDDLCDSFLQGFYYLFYKDGNFPDSYKELLLKVSEDMEKNNKEKEKKKFLKKLEKSINMVDIDL